MKGYFYKLKEGLRQTVIYTLYIKIKYLIYPLKLKLAGIKNIKPTEMGITENKKMDSKDVIISITSFPGRINIVHKTIYSLMHQTIKPNKIILYLAATQFPQKELPPKLEELIQYGLTIEWVNDDIMSYKKLIPALYKYKSDIIVTADDDIYYPQCWLEQLIESYKKNPQDIHCHLISKLIIKDGKVSTTKREKKHIDTAEFSNKILGGSGTLYPPNSLHDDVFNSNEFLKIAPTSDDIWFWAMAVRNNTKIRWIKHNMKRLYYTEYSQENTDCLWKINDRGECFFTKHINDIVEKYDLYKYIRER